MNSVNHPMSQGMGISQLDRLSQNPTERMPSRPEPDMSHHALADEVQISNRARRFFAARPVDLPLPGHPGGDSELASSIRKVGQFLKQHPEIAHSPLGKSVQMLMRGAVHLVKAGAAGGAGRFPREAGEKLSGVVNRVREFLENHPRVAGSPFGQAVAAMARETVSAITTDGSTLQDIIIKAAKEAQQFLETHSRIAEMPLGQVVEKLINGVRATAEGTSPDPDIGNLAKRTGHFVSHHPRLAESEFGQLIATLTRGILALESAIPPDVEPSVAGDIRPGAVVPVASEIMQASETIEKADSQKDVGWQKAA